MALKENKKSNKSLIYRHEQSMIRIPPVPWHQSIAGTAVARPH